MPPRTRAKIKARCRSAEQRLTAHRKPCGERVGGVTQSPTDVAAESNQAQTKKRSPAAAPAAGELAGPNGIQLGGQGQGGGKVRQSIRAEQSANAPAQNAAAADRKLKLIFNVYVAPTDQIPPSVGVRPAKGRRPQRAKRTGRKSAVQRWAIRSSAGWSIFRPTSFPHLCRALCRLDALAQTIAASGVYARRALRPRMALHQVFRRSTEAC